MNESAVATGFRPAGEIRCFAVSPRELAGMAEIAEMLSVSKRTAQRYSERDDFPEPIDRLAAGPVWRLRDVEVWAREQLPLPVGRPRKEGDEHG